MSPAPEAGNPAYAPVGRESDRPTPYTPEPLAPRRTALNPLSVAPLVCIVSESLAPAMASRHRGMDGT